jgi:hypothetical protein
MLLQLLHRGSSYYTEAPATFSTQTVEYYTEAPKYYSATIYTATTEAVKHYAAPTYYTKTAPSYCVEQKCYTDAPVYYTPTYAKSSNNTEASEYCTEEASYYTTTFGVPIYYTEVPKYYSTPSYNQTKAHKYETATYAAPTYTPKLQSIHLS